MSSVPVCTWSTRPTRVCLRISQRRFLSICLSVFAVLAVVTNTQMDHAVHATPYVAIDRNYAMHSMRLRMRSVSSFGCTLQHSCTWAYYWQWSNAVLCNAVDSRAWSINCLLMGWWRDRISWVDLPVNHPRTWKCVRHHIRRMRPNICINWTYTG